MRKLFSIYVVALVAMTMVVTVPAAASSAPVYNPANDSYYELVLNPNLTWGEAQADAESRTYLGREGHLVTITDASEQAFVEGLIGGNGVFIGLNDAATEGTFEWVTGESFGAYQNWAASEPNDYATGEDCAEIVGSGHPTPGKWNDVDCGFWPYENGYVVEYSAAVDPDTDGDGIPDATDNCPAIANADQADFDGDMLGDECDPDDDNDGVDDVDDAFPLDATESSDNDGDGIGDNADTDDDNDGQSDADEAACGSDPLDAASTSPDYDGDGIPDCVDPDDDNDGVDDVDDEFPMSDPSPTVIVDGVDTGVPNVQVDGGANMNDLIGACGVDPKNHGQYVSCVTQLTNDWRKADLITKDQEKAIDVAAAQSDIGK